MLNQVVTDKFELRENGVLPSCQIPEYVIWVMSAHKKNRRSKKTLSL